MGQIVVERVIELDEQLKAFMEANSPTTPEGLSHLQNNLLGDYVYNESERDYCKDDTTLLVARDSESKQVLASILLVRGQSQFQHEFQDILRQLGCGVCDKMKVMFPDKDIVQIEKFLADKEALGFTRVPELIKQFQAAIRSELEASPPKILYAVLENLQLVPIVEKLMDRASERHGDIYNMKPPQKEYERDLPVHNRVLVTSTSPEVDLSFLEKYDTKKAEIHR